MKKFFIYFGFLNTVLFGAIYSNAQVTGTFTDNRDGKVYKTVKIGSQTWMAENLNFSSNSGSWCYDGNNANCSKYGKLYDWETAKNVCPAGWHLPSKEELGKLLKFVGNNSGKKLKSMSGWNDSGNGIDKYGFNALPAGNSFFLFFQYSFDGIGKFSIYWSSTEYDAEHANSLYLSYDESDAQMDHESKSRGLSVRCIKD